VRLKGDQGTARASEPSLVLNQLRHDGPLGRAAIAAAVGLSPAAVTFVTAELIAEGLLVEREALLAASGRRPCRSTSTMNPSSPSASRFPSRR
jgi:predicted ArsR family transcriptional regulator